MKCKQKRNCFSLATEMLKACIRLTNIFLLIIFVFVFSWIERIFIFFVSTNQLMDLKLQKHGYKKVS
jgi:hypothetical protein